MQYIWTIFTSHSSKSLPLLILCTLKRTMQSCLCYSCTHGWEAIHLSLLDLPGTTPTKKMDSPFSRSRQLSITLQLGWSSWVTTHPMLEFWFDLVLVSCSPPRVRDSTALPCPSNTVSVQCTLPLAFAISPPHLPWYRSHLEMSAPQFLIRCILITCVSPHQLPSTAQRNFSNWNGGWTKKWVYMWELQQLLPCPSSRKMVLSSPLGPMT